jgi:hypothetical protein
MCKDCTCGNPEEIQYESSVEPSMNNNVVTISQIKGA